jgi:hypothetical protein
VGGKVNAQSQQMRALAEASQRRGENRVAVAPKPIGDALPAPAAAPCTSINV